MSQIFNPLATKMLFAPPARLHSKSAWNEHVPFAMLLVELAQPRVIVELGTHRGVSYGAWCQAVQATGAATQCYAVDTWAGDDHAGHYGNEIYEDLRQHHRQYESFSKLLRMTFDEALTHIPDGSVDLLHIDGLHFYEAVKHDFETWRPKLSDRAIVLFHDTVVVERGFGVHQFWREVAAKYPHFNFEHGYGLGVLVVGPDQPEKFTTFLKTAQAQPAAMRELFSALGGKLQRSVVPPITSEPEHPFKKTLLWRGLRKLKHAVVKA